MTQRKGIGSLVVCSILHDGNELSYVTGFGNDGVYLDGKYSGVSFMKIELYLYV